MSTTDNFPEQLRMQKQWCVHRAKVPFQSCAPSIGMDSTNPDHWSTYGEAVSCKNKDGIGFVFSHGVLGLDLDKCLGADNIPSDAALALLHGLPGSYCEISPSGNGLHIYWLCDFVGTAKQGGFEVYTEKRYFTVTGLEWKAWSKPLATLSAEQAELLVGRIKALKPARQRKASAPSNVGSKLNSLLLGDWQTEYPSQSDADLALCGHLARQYKNLAVADQMFRGSGLMRSKWDERHGEKTYGQMTLEKAFSSLQESEVLYEIVMDRADEIDPENIEYLVPGLVPLGMLVNIFASKGMGKTKLCDWLTAHISSGKDFPVENPDGSTDWVPGKPGTVIRFNLEDPIGSVLVPNLVAAGAHMARVRVPQREALRTIGLESTKIGVDFSNPVWIHALEKSIRSETAVLVIIEPFNNYKGKAKVNMEDDMRPIMQNLANLAGDTRCTIITVNHKNKKKDVDALESMLGAGSTSAVARVNHSVWKPSFNTALRLVGDTGSNIPLSPKSFGFSLVKHEPFEYRGRLCTGAQTWKFEGFYDASAEDHQDEVQDGNKSQSKSIEAWLDEFLSDKGKVNTDLIKKAASENDRSWTWEGVRLVWSRRFIKGKKGFRSTEAGKTFWSLKSAEKAGDLF